MGGVTSHSLDWTGDSNSFWLMFSCSWLLQDPEMQLRTTYKGFTEAVDAYFDHLMPIVVPLQASAIHYRLCPQAGTVCTEECELCVMAAA